MDVCAIRAAAAALLTAGGVPAVEAWPAGDRPELREVTAAVTFRRWESGPGGFCHYLGERQDPETGAWREVYGRRATVALGLDLYAPPHLGEGGCRAAFDRLCAALSAGEIPGLRLQEFSCGEVTFEEDSGLFRCPVEAVYSLFLQTAAEEGGDFLSFEVKGLRQ